MENRQDHRNNKTGEEKLKGARIAWSKSREEAWKNISARIGEQDRTRPAVRRLNPGKSPWVAVAASLLLLLAISIFMRSYTRTIETISSEHLTHHLPDGSTVEINAKSTITYHPFWWFATRQRQVSLEGEAFFRVKKGRRFAVESSQATTSVLGTSFNIYSRNSHYHAQCHSGQVKVSSRLCESSVVLKKGEEARMDPSGVVLKNQIKHQREVPAWTEHLVLFISTPLELVLQEIERQYGIVIEGPENIDLRYTGNFSLDESVENVLALVCRPFGLEYEQHTGKMYRIKEKRSP